MKNEWKRAHERTGKKYRNDGLPSAVAAFLMSVCKLKNNNNELGEKTERKTAL